MRLIDADVLKSKIREQPWKQETKVSLMLDWIYMLIDEASTVSTVQNKALQQEDEQLQAKLEDWKHEAQCHMDEVVARDKEIEKLRAHVARMREALEQIEEHLSSAIPVEGFFKNMHCCSAERIAEDALTAIDALGGKEDVTSMGD